MTRPCGRCTSCRGRPALWPGWVPSNRHYLVEKAEEERQERESFLNLVLNEYYALDKQLRAPLHDALLNTGS